MELEAKGSPSEPSEKIAAKDSAFPVHPLLFGAFPVLSLFSSNLAIVPLRDLWQPLGVTVAATALLWLVLWPLFRNLRTAATAASVISLMVFLFSTLAPRVGLEKQPLGWLLLTVVLAVAVGIKIRQTGILNLLATLLAVVAVGNIAISEARIAIDESRIGASEPRRAVTASGPTPDIFYIILDGYGRADSLKRAIHFDDAPFLDALRSRGFYVASRSHSNYVQTEISLASSLNLDLIPKLLPDQGRESSDRGVFDPLISDNELSHFLRDRGYRTIGITSGFPPIEFPHADLWLKTAPKYTLFETALIQMTPAATADRGIESMFTWRRETLLAAFQDVRDLAEPSGRPRFVFVHILAPHPPFVLDANEGFVRPRGPFGYWDGSDFMQYVGKPADYRAGYAGQVQAINTEVLKTVDALLRAAKVKPIIVLQGDHGSKVGLDQNDLAKTDLTECFPNLAAFYVPDTIRVKLYPEITPVNEFRIILGSLFGANLPLLPDRSWYSPFALPFEFTDVTSRVPGARLASRSRSGGQRARRPKGISAPTLPKG
jgi:hypothetical protein